jgi:type II secretory pathway pseudopilin PulG
MTHPSTSQRAWTIIELMTVLVIIMILASLVLPAFSFVRDRSEKASCMNNLKNLAGSAHSHMRDHNRWPQFTIKSRSDMEDAAKVWVDTLEPYGTTHKHWICPTVQRGLKAPDYTSDQDYRVDYWMTNFSPHPRAPYKTMTQPWFVEKQDVHGSGNLVIYPDGAIEALDDLRREGS